MLPFVLWLITGAQAEINIGFGESSDLTDFVTYPELKAPLFDIDVYDSDSLDAGYWFVGPYVGLYQPEPYRSTYYACQTGPHIYDQTGELIWSGACMFQNRVACDFRSFEANGTSFLSTITTANSHDPKGAGYILNQDYTINERLTTPPGMSSLNMHELTYVDEGRRALYIVNRPRYMGMGEYLQNDDGGMIVDLGIREVDLATGEETFIWWSSDHIALTESSAEFVNHNSYNQGWDWLHINSVTKNKDGDYLMSARYTNAIYKISKNGTILWRLGGTDSTFAMDFDFSRQHDAQWIDYNDDVELITLLDNGGDDSGYNTSDVSSVLTIRLDKRGLFATIVQRIDRPDGGKSMLRGNSQNLPNGNKFISWSDNAYFSEHAPDGRMLMQAKFKSKRSVTYRAYKFQWEGFPVEKPRLHASAYHAGDVSMTTFFVSWNGATNVAVWRFWRGDELLGEAPRTGFETAFQIVGVESLVYAEALDHNGQHLGKTAEVQVTVFPRSSIQRDTISKDEL